MEGMVSKIRNWQVLNLNNEVVAEFTSSSRKTASRKMEYQFENWFQLQLKLKQHGYKEEI